MERLDQHRDAVLRPYMARRQQGVLLGAVLQSCSACPVQGIGGGSGISCGDFP